jgi:hypothetical protein
MLALTPLILCITILATLITGLPAENHEKRYIPYKRQSIQNVTTTTIFVGTTSLVGEITTITNHNETSTVFVAHNTTYDMVHGTETGGRRIPRIPPTGFPNVFPTQGTNDTLNKRFFNEPSTTLSRAKKPFITTLSTVRGTLTA